MVAVVTAHVVKVDDTLGRVVTFLTDDPARELARRVVRGHSSADAIKKAQTWRVCDEARCVDPTELREALALERLVAAAINQGDAWVEENVPPASRAVVRAEVQRRRIEPDDANAVVVDEAQ